MLIWPKWREEPFEGESGDNFIIYGNVVGHRNIFDGKMWSDLGRL